MLLTSFDGIDMLMAWAIGMLLASYLFAVSTRDKIRFAVVMALLATLIVIRSVFGLRA